MRALLVVNPNATTFSSRVRDVLAHALMSETRLDVVETKARGHAVELATQAASDGTQLVVALGGDGTVNEVVNGLMTAPPDARPALAVVPGGSANVLARSLGFADDPVEATGQLLDALEQERTRTISLGLAEYGGEGGDPVRRWFTFSAGLGLDAAVVRAVERKRARGRRATSGLYARTGFARFFAMGRDRRDPPLRLSVPGREPEAVALALVCKTDPWTYLGNRPVRPCPRASFDGGLDVFAMRTLPTVRTLLALRQILSARPRLRGRQVLSLHDLPEVVVHARRSLPLQLDGDDLGDTDRVRFSSHPAALDLVV